MRCMTGSDSIQSDTIDPDLPFAPLKTLNCSVAGKILR